MSAGPDKANFPQSLFNHPSDSSLITPATSPLNQTGRACLLFQTRLSLAYIKVYTSQLRLTQMPTLDQSQTPSKGPVCTFPSCVNTVSPDPSKRLCLHYFKALLNYPLLVVPPTVIQQQIPALFQTHWHCFSHLVTHLIM